MPTVERPGTSCEEPWRSWQCIDNVSCWCRCQELTSWSPCHWTKAKNWIYGPRWQRNSKWPKLCILWLLWYINCKKVQEFRSTPAGSHRIGSDVYFKLKQGLPLSQENLRIIRGSSNKTGLYCITDSDPTRINKSKFIASVCTAINVAYYTATVIENKIA